MLNFRNTNIFFILLLLLMAGINMYMHIPVYFYVITVLVYSLILFYGSYYVGSNFFMKVLCSANTTQKQIAISFDDGPARQYTPEILKLLKSNNVPAAFFCIGDRVGGHVDLLRQAIEDGHIIGNHSYSHHFWFDLFSTKKMLSDVAMMSETVKEATGLRPKLFRPPYGVTTPGMKRVMEQGGYTAIGWNIRSLDTMIKDEKKLLQKIISSLQPGAIVLLHDTSGSTLSVLPELFTEVRKRGYEFVRLDKLLNVAPYA